LWPEVSAISRSEAPTWASQEATCVEDLEVDIHQAGSLTRFDPRIMTQHRLAPSRRGKNPRAVLVRLGLLLQHRHGLGHEGLARRSPFLDWRDTERPRPRSMSLHCRCSNSFLRVRY